MTIPTRAPTTPPPSTIDDVLMRGDLSKLTDQQRIEYMKLVCNSVGLNPLTRPFEYIILNGKLTLYARRDAADQLRKLHGISIEIISQEFKDGLYTVHVRAKDRDNRVDEDVGIVEIRENLRGEAVANLRLKCVTKAKRRVTLSISGLGFLDETEVADIPSAKPIEPIEHDPQTGEVEPYKDFGARTLIPIMKDEPEIFHKWLEAQCAAMMDIESLHSLFKMLKPNMDDGFPPDIEHAKKIFSKRRESIEKQHAQS